MPIDPALKTQAEAQYRALRQAVETNHLAPRKARLNQTEVYAAEQYANGFLMACKLLIPDFKES